MPDTKKLLKFYFQVDKLNGAIDNLILKVAMSSMDVRKKAEDCAERIGKLIEDKQVLGELWGYLDEVIGGLENADRAWLADYAASKSNALYDTEVKRATAKFTRHLHSLERYGEALSVLNHYFGMIG